MSIGSGAEELSKLQKQPVARVAVHQNYSTNSLDYDVAVIKVATPFTVGPNRKPIAFTSIRELPKDNERVIVSGWGITEVSELRCRAIISDRLSSIVICLMDDLFFQAEGFEMSEKLMAVDLNMINFSDCEDLYSGDTYLTSRMICAGRLGEGKDPCRGDNGGPLVSFLSGKQVGIVSWSRGCAGGEPGIYTNLADRTINKFITSELKK